MGRIWALFLVVAGAAAGPYLFGGRCAENERVEAHSCVACPPGATRKAGDDAAGGDTMCLAGTAPEPVMTTPPGVQLAPEPPSAELLRLAEGAQRAEDARRRKDYVTFTRETQIAKRGAEALLARNPGDANARMLVVAVMQNFAAAISSPPEKNAALDEALGHQKRLLASLPDNDQVRIVLSQLHVERNQFCDGVDLLEGLMDTRFGGDVATFVEALLTTYNAEKSVHQFAVASYNCDPSLSERAFDYLLASRYLAPSFPHRCLKCWGILGIVKRMLGKRAAFERLFAELQPYTPWVNPFQMPLTFNTLLATREPRFFPEDATIKGLLATHAAAIRGEYAAYEAHKAATFDRDHADAWMAQEDGGGWWEYLNLKLASGVWDEPLCRDWRRRERTRTSPFNVKL